MLKLKQAVTVGIFCTIIATFFGGCGLAGNSKAERTVVSSSSSDSSSTFTSSVSNSSNSQPSADTVLTYGQFVLLWMQSIGSSQNDDSINKAVTYAENKGIICKNIDSQKTY